MKAGSALRMVGDDVDFHQHVAGQVGGDGGAGGLVGAEVFGVDLLHVGEVLHGAQEDGGLHHGGEVQALALEHGADVVEHLLGLLADGAVDDVIGARNERYLAGEVEEVARMDGVGVMPQRGRRIRGGDEAGRLGHVALS